MSDDHIEFLMARARMRQHHEWAGRMHDLAQAENLAGGGRTRGRSEAPTRWALASLIRLFAAVRWIRATRRDAMHQDTYAPPLRGDDVRVCPRRHGPRNRLPKVPARKCGPLMTAEGKREAAAYLTATRITGG